MRLEGEFDVRAGRQEVYDFLTDPARVSSHMPDVKEFDIQDQDHFTVKASVGVSHIKGVMVMKLTISNRNPPVSTTVSGKGTGLGSNVDMVTSFVLDEREGGATLVKWQGDVTVSGKLASFGPQGLLDRMARKNVDKFIEGIKSGIEEIGSEAASEPSAKDSAWKRLRAQFGKGASSPE